MFKEGLNKPWFLVAVLLKGKPFFVVNGIGWVPPFCHPERILGANENNVRAMTILTRSQDLSKMTKGKTFQDAK
ncbi:hypothetical protein EFB08_03375 [Rufibacter latericius]|uniref:Uncharacterized protein n=1 Tax=Rufibacter latericius TaxID=2487040 RepID=A0A3M9N1A3_9BACT|nr:hypothetical protein EFB08_03375 [Rufibacter latericius]